jgi:hypothetical protein
MTSFLQTIFDANDGSSSPNKFDEIQPFFFGPQCIVIHRSTSRQLTKVDLHVSSEELSF